ncbi:TPA: hypothetical protein J6N41_003790 [Escherichia coli]|nr:hypothetical protein [Escherichia coli]EEZ6460254.1 hypothetical protein [Escherichia coli O16]EFJ8745554.1 hypothetical protein [Escherichia coli]EFJ9367936.1 hypothetical protein [Escherichia coli]EFO3491779.1 hypothetical protein [Escherichia coli]
MSDIELKSLNCLFNRISWSIVKSVLSSLGFSLGRGKDATFNKVKEQLIEIRDTDRVKFDSLLKKINDLLFSQFFYGDKAIFSLAIDAPTMTGLSLAIQTEWANTTILQNVSSYILNEQQLLSTPKNSPQLIFCSTDSNQVIALFSSVREQVIKEKVSPQTIPQYQSYDEIIAKKKVRRQCFDVCILNIQDNTINILIDAPKNVIGETITFSKTVIVRKLYDYMGADFVSTEKDFFPLIEQIFAQNTYPFNASDYQVFELSFYTPEGTTHQEKKKEAKKDLRDDIFNQEGIKAVGQIGLYKIGIKISRVNVLLSLDDDLELIIPGSLRRYLGGSSSTSVNYAIINNCLGRDDFERLMSLIV